MPDNDCKIAADILSSNTKKRSSLIREVVLPALERPLEALKSASSQGSEPSFFNFLGPTLSKIEARTGVRPGDAHNGVDLPSFQQVGKNSAGILSNQITQNALAAVNTSATLDGLSLAGLKEQACVDARLNAEVSRDLLLKAEAVAKAVPKKKEKER